MNDFDNWFYSLLNMKELAKFVKESTTFSHTFEAMKQQKQLTRILLENMKNFIQEVKNSKK